MDVRWEQCIASIGGLTEVRATRRKEWTIAPRIIGFFSSMLGDKAPSVRRAAATAVGYVANAALVEGNVELDWAVSLLARARKDSAYSVKKAAVVALLRLDQTRNKLRTQAGR